MGAGRGPINGCSILERRLTFALGPAHAVYFGTYEVVKELAGGNKMDGKHHPLAAGTSNYLDVIWFITDYISRERSKCHDCF